MLLDIGTGILWGVLFDNFSNLHSLSTFALFGAAANLAPDLDYIYHLYKGGNTKNDHRHREVFHKPYFLLLGAVIIGLAFDWLLAGLFVLGALTHFLHDSIGIGWGVQWLAPFSSDHFAFLYRVHTAAKPQPAKQLVYRWPNKDIDKLNRQHGDPDWFRNTYLKWHPFAVFEGLVLLIALVVLWLAARSA
ncbi:MAG TPA: metal-dependent hydrolase [Candidatus Saccharimonadales bacterium]